MKKLLSLLASVSMVATAGMAVVACSTSDKDKDDVTSTIFKDNSSLGNLDSEQIVDGLLSEDNGAKALFGDEGEAAKTFMNYFAEAVMQYINKKVTVAKDDNEKIKAIVDKDALPYLDDDTLQTISKDWDSQMKNANDAWDKLIKDDKEKYGKKFESSTLSDLKSQFGKKIYSKKQSKYITAEKYEDYKDLYISYTILNGSSDGKSLYQRLKEDVYGWGKSPAGESIDWKQSKIVAQIFHKKLTIGNDNIDFSQGTIGGPTQTTKPDEGGKSLIAQMQKFLAAVNGLADGDDKNTYLDYIIDMYNITGGLKTDGTASLNLKNIEWATRDNIGDAIKDPLVAANELIKRFDSNYDTDFGTKSKDGNVTSVSSLDTINTKYDISNSASKLMFSSIYSDAQKGQPGSQIAGLYSNAQRFVANDYLRNEKPVAVSEIVVSPLYTASSNSQIINNSGFVPNDSNTQMLTDLYGFIGNFVNKDISDNYKSAKTDDRLDKSSDYSWDQLMTQISATWPDDANTDNSKSPIVWGNESSFKGKVKFNSHSNLLTVNSSTSDYSSLLKNSVYDYLANPEKAPTWDFSKSDGTIDSKVPGMILPDTFDNNNKNNPNSNASDAYKKITLFVQSLSRNSTHKNMYEVVNAKQGIISFIDTDGIHFVRIEGFDKLKEAATDQAPLSTVDFNNKDKANQAKADFYAVQSLNTEISSNNDETKNSAVVISNDYMDDASEQQNKTGLKYSDLNKGFGNKYLQFLANTSIPKTLGFASPKYSYDFNSLLSDYAGGDITTDSVTKGTNMTLMVWNYFKAMFGLNKKGVDGDTILYNWIVSGDTDNGPDSSSKPSTKSMVFNPLKDTDWADEVTKKFIETYKNYITNQVLGFYRDDMRSENSDDALTNGYVSADNATEDTTWNDVSADAYNSTATWSKDDKNYYNNTKNAINNSPYWQVDKNTPASQQLSAQINHNILIRDQSYKYKLDVSEFIPNQFALKGDDE